jgi:hypothetical protein
MNQALGELLSGPGLTSSARALAIAILEAMPDSGTLTTSFRALQASSGIGNRQTLRAALNRLADAGVIVVTYSRTGTTIRFIESAGEPATEPPVCDGEPRKEDNTHDVPNAPHTVQSKTIDLDKAIQIVAIPTWLSLDGSCTEEANFDTLGDALGDEEYLFSSGLVTGPSLEAKKSLAAEAKSQTPSTPAHDIPEQIQERESERQRRLQSSTKQNPVTGPAGTENRKELQ